MCVSKTSKRSEFILSSLVINLERNHHACFFLSPLCFLLWFCLAGRAPLISLFDKLFFKEEEGVIGVIHTQTVLNMHAWVHIQTILRQLGINSYRGDTQCIHLYLEHQGGCVCMCVGWNFTPCQSVTAWIRFTSVCSVCPELWQESEAEADWAESASCSWETKRDKQIRTHTYRSTQIALTSVQIGSQSTTFNSLTASWWLIVLYVLIISSLLFTLPPIEDHGGITRLNMSQIAAYFPFILWVWFLCQTLNVFFV